MIAKILTRKSSGRTAQYCLDHDNAKILISVGLDIKDNDAEQLATMAENTVERKELVNRMVHNIDSSFNVQSQLNPRVEKAVGHIPVSFLKDDEKKLTDETMIEIAREYLIGMNILNTQIMVVRHFPKNGNPHFHIFYNRVNNDGKLIAIKNDFYLNAKVCKEIKKKFHLTFSEGKKAIDENALYGRERYMELCRRDVEDAVAHSFNWNEFQEKLMKKGIIPLITHDDRTGMPKGVTFKYTVNRRTYYFAGKKLDKNLGYGSILHRLETNKAPMEEVAESVGSILGLVAMASSGGGKSLEHDISDDDEELKRRMKKRMKFPRY